MRPAGTVRGRHRLRGGLRALAALLALAGVAVLIAGCGGASSPGVANIPGRSTSGRHSSSSAVRGGGVRFAGFAPSPAQRAQSEVAALKFSRCMRSHGAPDFPDPSASGGIRFGGGISGLDPAAPLFRVAQRTCISLLFQRLIGG